MLRSLRAILRQFSVLALACKLVLDDSGRGRSIRRREKLKLGLYPINGGWAGVP